MNIEEKLAKYTEAKEAYYNSGESVMSDYDFDVLEQQLINAGAIHLDTVGITIDETKDKKKHKTTMLSLAKVQVFGDNFEKLHFEEIERLFKRQGIFPGQIIKLMSMFKMDGCSLSLNYTEGNFTHALTRGDGIEGINVAGKLLKAGLIIKKLPVPFSGEIRGEVLLKKQIFTEKYLPQGYKNARNLVAGILNDDNVDDPRTTDLNIVLFDVRGEVAGNYDIRLKQLGLEPPFVEACQPALIDFSLIDLALSYTKYKELRESSPYLIDGIVYKMMIPDFDWRKIKDNGHDPYHMAAVKFPPKETITKIIRIDWQLNKTGRYTPVGILEPVDLDGSTVTRVSLHNIDNVITKKLYPGCEISIAKNGDIIPAVQKVISLPEDYTEEMLTQTFPEGTRREGAYLVDDGTNAHQVNRIKFISALSHLGFDDFAGAAFSKLYTFTEGDWTRLFDVNYTNITNLVDFFPGLITRKKLLERIEERRKKGIQTYTLILMMGINQLGFKIATQLALQLAGYEPDFKGLDRGVIRLFNEQSGDLMNIIEILGRYGVFSIPAEPESNNPDQITFEMTGDVNVPGFNTKGDFKKHVSLLWKHTSLKKDTTYLITDSMESNTNKMKTAAKYGIKTMTYQDALDLYGSQL